MADLLIKGATLLHLDPPGVEQADVLVGDGTIEFVGPDLEVVSEAPVYDATGRWLMPGLVCGHHHLYSALACGMPFLPDSPTDFADMLAKVWWRLDEALDRDSVEVSGLVGGLGALRAGVTTVIDHHASPNFIEGSLECLDGALEEVGLRRILCYEVSDRGGASRARAGLRAHEGILAAPSEWRAALVGVHANFTVTDVTLGLCGDLARSAGVGLHIHVAEAVDDAAATGEDLVGRMERLGALVPGSILAHGVHLSAEQHKRVRASGCWVSHQPRSNMNNAVGYARVAEFGPHTFLGTDGIGADMFAELQAGWFRAQEGRVPWGPDRWLRALAASARFAGERLGLTLGRIRPGAAADLVVLDPVPGPPLTAANLPSAMIFRLSASAVRDVFVGGQLQLRDRQPTRLDPQQLDRRATASAVALWDRMS